MTWTDVGEILKVAGALATDGAACNHRIFGRLRRKTRAKMKDEKPRGFPRGFGVKNVKRNEAFRPWQTWQRPTLPSLET